MQKKIPEIEPQHELQRGDKIQNQVFGYDIQTDGNVIQALHYAYEAHCYI